MNQEQIQEICYGIAIHADGKADFEGQRTLFAVSVMYADNIDRVDVYRIYEELQYDKFSLLPLEGRRKRDAESADDCIGCGGCEAVCPFGVPVKKRMEQTRNLF